jgi:hypothetical protein
MPNLSPALPANMLRKNRADSPRSHNFDR